MSPQRTWMKLALITIQNDTSLLNSRLIFNVFLLNLDLPIKKQMSPRLGEGKWQRSVRYCTRGEISIPPDAKLKKGGKICLIRNLSRKIHTFSLCLLFVLPLLQHSCNGTDGFFPSLHSLSYISRNSIFQGRGGSLFLFKRHPHVKQLVAGRVRGWRGGFKDWEFLNDTQCWIMPHAFTHPALHWHAGKCSSNISQSMFSDMRHGKRAPCSVVNR